ncbi:MAG: glycosyltransferase family 2 protein [Chitinophagaceae bacterium]|nr:glycosyltransferase family 2 protein [Chitinophagaceae bacterium]
MDVSVIICCHNSAALLPETLRHLSLQKVNKNLNWEIIIVNNNSNDETTIVACTIMKELGLSEKLIIVDEPQPGQIHARRKGVMAAKGEYLIFCDDDNWLYEDYVQTSFRLLNETPDAGAIGGRTFAAATVELPEWWEDYAAGYAVGKQNTEPGDVSDRKYIWGAGMITRKSIIEKVWSVDYPFFLSGRKGTQLSSGDDSEICIRLLLMGFKLYYNEDLKLTHFMEAKRLTDNYRDKLFASFEESSKLLSNYYLVLDNSKIDHCRMSLHLKILNSLVIGFKYLQHLFSRRKRQQNLIRLNALWNTTIFPLPEIQKQMLRFRNKFINHFASAPDHPSNA